MLVQLLEKGSSIIFRRSNGDSNNSFSRFGSFARNCCLNGMNIHHVVSQVVKWAVFGSRNIDLNLAPFWSIFVSSCEALSQFTSTFMLINL